nr:putative late blight resistance protein homolog R1B-14 [Ipomoea batatas]
MSILGSLDELEVLKLDYQAFLGEVCDVSNIVFKRLKYLRIQKTDLVSWIVSKDSFPVLEYLVLSRCDSLDAIPSAFGEVESLKEMELIYINTKAANSARQIQNPNTDANMDFYGDARSLQLSTIQCFPVMFQQNFQQNKGPANMGASTKLVFPAWEALSRREAEASQSVALESIVYVYELQIFQLLGDMVERVLILLTTPEELFLLPITILDDLLLIGEGSVEYKCLQVGEAFEFLWEEIEINNCDPKVSRLGNLKALIFKTWRFGKALGMAAAISCIDPWEENDKKDLVVFDIPCKARADDDESPLISSTVPSVVLITRVCNSRRFLNALGRRLTLVVIARYLRRFRLKSSLGSWKLSLKDSISNTLRSGKAFGIAISSACFKSISLFCEENNNKEWTCSPDGYGLFFFFILL